MKKKYYWITLLFMLVFLAGCGQQLQPVESAEPLQEMVREDEADAEELSDATEDASADMPQSNVQDEEAVVELNGDLSVTFLDVGEGNAVLVEQNGAYMLIDGGDREYSSFVVSYLQNAGVQELEYVIASHYDADHLNGVVGVLNVYPCKTVLAADYTTDTRVYESFCEVVKEQDVELVYPAMGDQYSFGDVTFTIVCPDAYDYEEANDNSIGIRLEYGTTSFLICGDAGAEVEQVMMQSGLTLDSDVYLASHHGSEYSSSYEFLQAVSPSAVVISVGADNSYGHPTPRVLNDIAAIGADVYRTDELGTIQVISDGSTLTFDKVPVETVGASNEQTPGGTVESEDIATQPETAEQDDEVVVAQYVMNRNTKKFHLPECSSVEDISIENRADFTGSREELMNAGYEPCKRCNP